ncbi:DUF6799 domain-containing protein [Hymenobacter sp. CRA2]|uniref:DUF6799 domain-containing protein n=1 Tax=Hymenobacter sp. CRA2 TaxID=1955620 RepID=UPI001590F495|nr:DUF6799 domain-containing protein [Hymenobacter sp. CRA2]
MGTKTTPVTKNVVLINGTRLDFQTRTALLPGGGKVELHEGDMVTLYGEVHQSAEAKAATKAPAAPSASAPAAPTASAAPTAAPAL